MKTYTGGCHCAAVRFEADTDIGQAIECNCSHCSRKGFLLHFVPAGQFRLLKGEQNLTEYRFNKKKIAHLICSTCGVESFARGQNRDGTPTVMINVRCVDGVDPHALSIKHINGKDF